MNYFLYLGEYNKTIMKKILILFSLIALVCACGPTQQMPRHSSNDRVNYGYGTEERSTSTYNVANVKVDQNEISGYSSIADYLRGRVAGVEVSGSDDNPTIRIRGVRSINGSNEPLIFVDNVEVNDLSGVVPMDVERIDVLKDNAASMYGSRGANGVILITTRRAARPADE